MNAVLKEDINRAIERLFAKQISDGYLVTQKYPYLNPDRSIFCYRVRLDSDKGKIFRPVYQDCNAFVIGEPPTPITGKPLFRWERISAAPSDSIIWVVEGETCAFALSHALGVVAVTSGSATSASSADWSPLKGRRVRVWPDNDSPGLAYAAAVVAKLSVLGVECEVIDVVAAGMKSKEDCVDWLAAKENATLSDLLSLPVTKKDSQIRSEPEPLSRPVPQPEPYPIQELGNILGPACESLRRVIQAPDAVCGASLLAAAALAAQGLADVELDGRVYPISLWALTVAESGQRKSAVDAEAMRAAREHEKNRMRDYLDACASHTSEMEEWNVRREAVKTAARQKKGEGLARDLDTIGPPPAAPLRPTLVVADFTVEGLTKMLMTGLPSVGAFTDEAALVFGGHGMQPETTSRTAGTLSKMWDSGTIDRVRAADGAAKLYGRRLSMHLMAQPVIAERAFSDNILSGQGFLARCLLAWPQSTAGERLYKAESLRDDPAMIRCTQTFASLHAKPMPMAEDQRNELFPRRLSLTQEAFAAWRDAHDMIEMAIRPGEQFSRVQAWASKTPEQILRIAGVLTLLESPDARDIDQPIIERAVELALWHLGEAARLAGTAEISREVRDAQSLLDWCHSKNVKQLCSSEALRLGPPRIRELDRFNWAVDALESAGWAVRLEGGAEIDGVHRRNVWSITPKTEVA